jgi:serine/threonine protein kinase
MASLQVNGKMLETSCGSPHYACPEIIRGVRYDGGPADIWSCGVILYALLTGNLPFDDENIRRLLGKVKTGLFFIPEHVSPGARDLLKKMLVVDPTKRITMKELLRNSWFNSRAPKCSEALKYLGEAKTFTQPLLQDETQVDFEIVSSLNQLGWNSEKEILHALLAPTENVEKVFYSLLLQRKVELLENYGSINHNSWDVEGGPRRRTDSYTSLYAEKSSSLSSLKLSRTNIFKSDASLVGLPPYAPLKGM